MRNELAGAVEAAVASGESRPRAGSAHSIIVEVEKPYALAFHRDAFVVSFGDYPVVDMADDPKCLRAMKVMP